MTINGKEVNFKISNLKHAAAMELALKKMEESEQKIGSMKDKSLVNVLSSMVSMFRQFFVDATEEDVLDDCEDLAEAREAYETFLKEIKHQKAIMLAPYAPEMIE